MREIKFRAWDKEKKKMCNVVTMTSGCDGKEWGWFVTMGCWRDVVPEDAAFYGDPNIKAIADQYKLNPSDHILMQYTGLKDKNGKEIYEGDIVKDILYGMGIIKIGEYENMDGEYYPEIYGPFVQFRKKNCADDTQQQGLLQRREDEEVLGNIYEHPELLDK
jgi:uncharacterized phage protein (TIGR01671 family)